MSEIGGQELQLIFFLEHLQVNVLHDEINVISNNIIYILFFIHELLDRW